MPLTVTRFDSAMMDYWHVKQRFVALAGAEVVTVANKSSSEDNQWYVSDACLVFAGRENIYICTVFGALKTQASHKASEQA